MKNVGRNEQYRDAISSGTRNVSSIITQTIHDVFASGIKKWKNYDIFS